MGAVGIWGVTPSRGSGIGLAIALSILGNGGTPVYIFGRSKSKLEVIETRVPGISGRFAWDPADDSLAQSYQQFLIDHGITAIVISIGIGFDNPVPFLGTSEMQAMFQSNLLAPLTILRASLVPLRHHGGGLMVFLGSIVSYAPREGAAGYTASKMGLRGLVEAARVELRHGFPTVSIHGLYAQSVRRIGLKAVTDSVDYLLRLPHGTHADIILNGQNVISRGEKHLAAFQGTVHGLLLPLPHNREPTPDYLVVVCQDMWPLDLSGDLAALNPF